MYKKTTLTNETRRDSIVKTSMELRSDDLRPVTILATNISDELQASRSRTDRIEKLLNSIAEVQNIDSKELFKTETTKSESDEKSKYDEVEQLKVENLELMMEIQREEFISKKWNSIILQNEEILDLTNEWLRKSSESHSDTIKQLEYKADHAREELEYSIRCLRNEQKFNSEGLKRLELMFDELKTCLDNSSIQTQQESLIALTEQTELLQRKVLHD